jgi:tetratricopeptide (TPR) repeat protein
MIFSSNTIFTAEPRRRARRLARVAVVLAMMLAPLASHAEPRPGPALIAAARVALRRDDGIDAEMKLRAAMAQGVSTRQVAAYMGSAYLRQGDLVKARQWLGPAAFTQDTAAEGLRVLAQLELLQNHLPAAGRAYDRALAITPDDAGLWVEIGRWRYRSGQHVQAISACDRAIALDPRNVRALGFRGELVRDRYGLAAGLPWFEAALALAPQDASVLTQYAATLGDLGRATQALAVTRRLLQASPGNAQAFYLQAVLAARAGQYDVARQLLNRTRDKLDAVPGAILLQAVLELSADNPQTASELCEQLLEREPDSMRARQLLARALYLGEQYRYLTLRFRDDIARSDASPYLLTVVARGFEALGDRAKAGDLLDRAASPPRAALRIVAVGSRVGELMGQGQSQQALAAAEQDRRAQPGSYLTQSLAGDVQLALGHPVEAQQRYAAAARVRMTDSLLQRRFQAFVGAGNYAGATQMVQAYLQQDPGNHVALRLQAGLALHGGDPLWAGAILDYLQRTGVQYDVQLLTDLALIRLGTGEADLAERAAAQAYDLQRGSPIAAQTLALSYATLGIKRSAALSLLDKARQMLGDNPLQTEARNRLRQVGQG